MEHRLETGVYYFQAVWRFIVPIDRFQPFEETILDFDAMAGWKIAKNIIFYRFFLIAYVLLPNPHKGTVRELQSVAAFELKYTGAGLGSIFVEVHYHKAALFKFETRPFGGLGFNWGRIL
jgi:hypothetical protein